MNSLARFESAVDSYQRTVATRSQEVASSNYFFVNFEISKLFPDQTEEVDRLDWSKIYLTA